uniref:transmembrane protein 79-like n=1 Tax=Myxine glutinosa TaxID=7769 RepID=UPI00358E0E6C
MSQKQEDDDLSKMQESLNNIINQLQGIGDPVLPPSTPPATATQPSTNAVRFIPERADIFPIQHSTTSSWPLLCPPSPPPSPDKAFIIDMKPHSEKGQRSLTDDGEQGSSDSGKPPDSDGGSSDRSPGDVDRWPPPPFPDLSLMQDLPVQTKKPRASTPRGAPWPQGDPRRSVQPMSSRSLEAESIELVSRGFTRDEGVQHIDGGEDHGDHGCCAGRCQRGPIHTLLAALLAMILAPCLLYTCAKVLPFETPHLPGVLPRIVYALRCCFVAALPLAFGVVGCGLSRLCSWQRKAERNSCSSATHTFVHDSAQQLLLFCINLLVFSSYAPSGALKLLPILAGIFVLARLIYWLTINSWYSSFGFCLAFFPTLALMTFNLYSLSTLGLARGITPTSAPALQPSPTQPPVYQVQVWRD